MNISFEKLSAAYRSRSVLEEVSFSVPEGSITALIGCNGAGKSTLLSCLNGEKRDYRGKICLQGQDIRNMDMGQRSCVLSCMPQVLPRPRVTVAELVSFGRTPYLPLTGRLSEQDRQQVDQAIEAAGLSQYRDCFVDTLSGGERKKAFFAMILAQDTPVVAMDEPTAHLDAASRFAFLELIQKMRSATGKTFLIVLHELPEILRYADRIVVLKDGKVAFTGTGEECLRESIPESCFGISVTGSKESGYAAVPLK